MTSVFFFLVVIAREVLSIQQNQWEADRCIIHRNHKLETAKHRTAVLTKRLILRFYDGCRYIRSDIVPVRHSRCVKMTKLTVTDKLPPCPLSRRYNEYPS